VQARDRRVSSTGQRRYIPHQEGRQANKGGVPIGRKKGPTADGHSRWLQPMATAGGCSRWPQPVGRPGVEKSSNGRFGDLPLFFLLLKRLPTQLAPLATQLKPLRPKLTAPVMTRPMPLHTLPLLLLLPVRPLSLLMLLLLLLLLPVAHGDGAATQRVRARVGHQSGPTQPSAATPSHALCAGGGR